MDCRIIFEWADGSYPFALRLGELEELQEKTGVGPFALFARLQDTSWHVRDIRETIRLGLIGGGMEAIPALRLVERYVDGKPLVPNVMPAMAILGAALLGKPGDKPGKSEAGRKAEAAPARKRKSASASSTAPAP